MPDSTGKRSMGVWFVDNEPKYSERGVYANSDRHSPIIYLVVYHLFLKTLSSGRKATPSSLIRVDPGDTRQRRILLYSSSAEGRDSSRTLCI